MSDLSYLELFDLLSETRPEMKTSESSEWSKMANTEDFLFHSQVEHQNKTHLLTLTRWQLIWEATSKQNASGSQVTEPLICTYYNYFPFCLSMIAT